MENWKKKEKKDAKDFGGKQTKASGLTWSMPGDVKNETYLIDSKHTDSKSFTVTKQIWNKLYEEALFSYRAPLLSVQMQDLELVVLSKEDFLKNIARISKLEEAIQKADDFLNNGSDFNDHTGSDTIAAHIALVEALRK